jgi:asparagine synthase (glutamine-hydrolysing)
MSAIFGLITHQGDAERREETGAKMSAALTFRGDLVTSFSTGDIAVLGARNFADELVNCGFSNGIFTVVFEGDIYNSDQLINELQLDKDTQTSEVILASYIKYGLDFAKRINGIFSIALYDAEKRQLILTRDHVGSHSLYYANNIYGFFFATTTRALLQSGLVEHALSPYGIHSYFSSTAISPPDTIYSKIYCLRPGTSLSINAQGDVREHTYWRINELEENAVRSLDDFAEELRELLIDAIEIRALAGRNYGSIVSGGVDTSVVTAVLARDWKDIVRMPAFSIVFAERKYSDAALQQVMYESFNLKPNSAVISARQYWDFLREACANFDCPVNDDAAVGMYRVFQLARSVDCRVVFEGEAADELFFTGHVHSERSFQKYLKIPYSVRKKLIGSVFSHNTIGGGFGNKALRLLFKMGLSDTERRLLVLPSFYRTKRSICREQLDFGGRDPLETARGYLMETQLKDPLNIYYYGLIKSFLPDVLLYKNERMAAANQVTNRTPFIDYRLVELALKIPEKFKVRTPDATDDGTKIVYKKAIEGIIPETIRTRKKTRGFSIPSSDWYRNELKDDVQDLLFGRNAMHPEYLDSTYVAEINEMHKKRVAGTDMLFNSILVFEMWLRENGAR